VTGVRLEEREGEGGAEERIGRRRSKGERSERKKVEEGQRREEKGKIIEIKGKRNRQKVE